MAGFGNYPNPGHCVVENTVSSMSQLVKGLAEERSLDSLNLNQYEERAYCDLYDLCENIMREVERLERSTQDERVHF